MNKILTTPNFFILGAPKCGTTSMARWLSEHPNVFMSQVKEPHYFNKDHQHRVVTDRTHYLSLFKDAGPEHHVVGEASVWYLYSKVAVDHILDTSTDSPIRFIVMLRNPAKMAYSLHEQQVFNMNEPETDFLKAWKLQDDRKQNKNLGITTRDPQLLVYGEVCKLGAQLQGLYEKVPKEQVKVVLLEDIKENALDVYREVLSFLEVPYDGRITFEAENTAKVRRSPVLAQTTKLLGKTKQKLGITKGFGLLNKANAVNVRSRDRATMEWDTRRMLTEYFAEDIALLATLIDRDLSHWNQYLE